jgi:transcriptional antiterminator NusG
MVATKEESNEGINYRVDSDAWYVVRNTNGVTGFVGVGSDPIPMEDDEVKNIFDVIGIKNDFDEKVTKEVIKINFQVGDFVTIGVGGFAGHEGRVAEIDMEHQKAKVMVEMFGRMTPVEVDFDSLEKE